MSVMSAVHILYADQEEVNDDEAPSVRALIDSNPKGRDVGRLKTKGC